MKPDYDLLFGNPFANDERITNSRFFAFASDALNNLIAANSANQYDATIALLTPLVAAFGDERSDVAVALNKQLGDTDATDALMEELADTMRDKETEIAFKVGGKGTAGYLMFYPNGLRQYRQATKSAMPVLTDQLSKAATTYSAQLGAPLTTLLSSFATRWQAARNTQQQQMGAVDNNRAGRGNARAALETGVLQAIHTVALSDLGNVQLGRNIFRFALLFGQTHHAHQQSKGTIGAGKTTAVANRIFPASALIKVGNTGTNAAIAVYSGATAEELPEADAIVLNPGEQRDLKASALGNSNAAPFVLIHNTSAVNDGAFEVEMVG